LQHERGQPERSLVVLRGGERGVEDEARQPGLRLVRKEQRERIVDVAGRLHGGGEGEDVGVAINRRGHSLWDDVRHGEEGGHHDASAVGC